MPQTKEQVDIFLKSLTFGMHYQILEEGQDDEEIKKIAEKHHLQFPCRDLSIFKGIYGFVNEENLNGCTLPKDEVKKSLNTLNGKAVDFDHLRKMVVGYWLEGSLEKDQIIAYGVFFKGSLAEEYDELKKLFNDGNLKISFEAWGNREFKDKAETSYDLTEIEFAGGALLIDTQPAFKGAKVLELANILKAPKYFVREKGNNKEMNDKEQKYLDSARFFVSDTDHMMKLLSQVDCPSCAEPYSQDINSIDYQGGSMSTNCRMCGSTNKVYMTPKAKVTKEAPAKITNAEVELSETFLEEFEDDDKLQNLLEDTIEESKKLSTDTRNNLSDESFAVVKTVKNKKTGKDRKIRMFPIHDATHVRNALSRIAQTSVQDNLKKMGISVESVKNKIEKKAKELKIDVNKSSVISEEDIKMDEKIKNLEQEVAKLSEQIKAKDTEIANLTTQVQEEKSKVEAANTAVETLKSEKEVAVNKAKEQATLVANRRAELGSDYAKDLSDEDIIDEVKFENAKLKKEVAELKKGSKKEEKTQEKGSKQPETTLAVGSKENTESDINKRQKKVREYAFGA